MVRRKEAHHSKLGGYVYRGGKIGKVWENPHIPIKWRGINMRHRVKIHENTERKLRRQGMKLSIAHHKALKKEHRGLTQKEISAYEGKLGAIARWHPQK